MLSSRRLFFCFLLSALVIYNVRARQIGTANKKCVEIGEYCQTHSDCCTGYCPLFPGQRCKLSSSQQDVAALPDDKSKTGTHALEKVDSSVLTAYSPQVDEASQVTCSEIGERCIMADECCSKRCLSYVGKCVS